MNLKEFKKIKNVFKPKEIIYMDAHEKEFMEKKVVLTKKQLYELIVAQKTPIMVRCPICGQKNKQEDMIQARYDINEEVCETCHDNGN